LEEALICYETAVAAKQARGEGVGAEAGQLYGNMAIVYQQLGRGDDAIAANEKALQVKVRLVITCHEHMCPTDGNILIPRAQRATT